MSLTNEQKAGYVVAIAAIWPNLSNNTVNNISDEVAGIMDTVLESIKTCSLGFAAIDILFDVIYNTSTATTWKDLLVTAFNAVSDWVNALMNNQQYQACVVTAAANWRSAIEMALMGITK